MTNQTLDPKSLISFPAIYLWAVAEIAFNTHDSIEYQKIIDFFELSKLYLQKTNRKKLGTIGLFSRAVKRNFNKGIIPFTRAPHDLCLAEVLFGETNGFKVRSDSSQVESGFLRVRKTDIDYVDLVYEITRDDAHLQEFLDNEKKESILQVLNEMASNKVEYETINQNMKMVRISQEFSAITNAIESFDCFISLWNAPSKGSNEQTSTPRSLSRKLGKAKLSIESGELYLLLTSSQQVLEMTAGSMVGQCLFIESEDINIFGKLPDLTVDNDRTRATLNTTSLFRRFLIDQMPLIQTDRANATYLINKYTWCLPYQSINWLETAEL